MEKNSFDIIFWGDYLELFQSLTQTDTGKIIFTGIISMAPVIELRGAIPIGVGLGLNVWTAYIAGIIGNMIPVPFIIIFIRRIFEFFKKRDNFISKFVKKLEKKVDVHSEAIYKSEIIGLFIFVAIPFPGTGAWTGALIAALLNLRFKIAMPTIFAGVVVAGFVVSLITHGVSTVVV